MKIVFVSRYIYKGSNPFAPSDELIWFLDFSRNPHVYYSYAKSDEPFNSEFMHLNYPG